MHTRVQREGGFGRSGMPSVLPATVKHRRLHEPQGLPKLSKALHQLPEEARQRTSSGLNHVHGRARGRRLPSTVVRRPVEEHLHVDGAGQRRALIFDR